MKFVKVIFILSLISILILTLLSWHINTPLRGKVERLEFSVNKITIKLFEFEEELIIFQNNLLDIKEGDEILFWGRKETYKGKEQVIVERIEKISN
jgi:hypothetical protein